MYRMVYVTFPSIEEAKKVSRTLLEEGLLACSNIFPGIISIYRWQGKIEEEEEVSAVLKTRNDVVDRLIARLVELHSYDVPSVTVYNIEKGHRDYLEWIGENVR